LAATDSKQRYTSRVLHDRELVELAFIHLHVFTAPRDAVRKRGLCCRPVSVCPSVTRRY